MATYQELRTRSQQVRDEQNIGGNTALRVGQLLMDIVKYFYDTDMAASEYLEQHFAMVNDGTHLLNWQQSPIVILHTMGETYDDGDFSALSQGENYYRAGFIMEANGQGGGINGETPKANVLYVNLANDTLYTWNGSSFDAITSGGGGGSISGDDIIKNAYYSNGNLVLIIETEGGDKTVTIPVNFDAQNYVPTSRTVNGKALSSNITLSQSDIPGLVAALAAKVGYSDDEWLQVKAGAIQAASAVPNTTTVNGKRLNNNIVIGMSDIQGLETAIGEAGKVKSVSVNNGTPVQPDSNGNVNIEVEGGGAVESVTINGTNHEPNSQGIVDLGTIHDGEDGITPHIGQDGYWYIGSTKTNTKAQGPKGDSGVASADEVVVVHDLDGEPDNLPQGKEAVLGADMGEEIGDRLDEIDATLNDVFGGEVSVVVNGNRVTLEIGASASEPRLIINAYGTDFMDTELNTSKVKHFTLTGRKLTANASISIASSNSAFLLSSDGTNYLPTITLNAGSDGKVSQVVYVKFTPTSELSYSTTITATSGSASATTEYQGTGAAEVTPSIVLQSNLDTITTDAVGNPATLQFVVYGYNLNAPIALSASVDSGSTAALDINSVSAAEAENGKVVTLTFTPGDATDDTITITATSTGATTETLEITGKVVIPPAVNDVIVVDGYKYTVATQATLAVAGEAKIGDKSATQYTTAPFSGDVVIPDQINYNGYRFNVIGMVEWAFGRSSATSVRFGANMRNGVIGGGLSRMNNLQTVVMNNDVGGRIGTYAFYESKLPRISIPDSVTAIGGTNSFQNCTMLTTVVIGTTRSCAMASFGAGSFSECTSLSSITCWATTPPSIGSGAFPSQAINVYVPAESVAAYQAASGWNASNITINAITE